MRLLLFFDLPMVTNTELREYRRFRGFLLKNGFVMMQESVYSKLTLNNTTMDAVMNNVRKNKPKDGLVQMLSITEKQFAKIEFVVGKSTSSTINSDERLIIL